MHTFLWLLLELTPVLDASFPGDSWTRETASLRSTRFWPCGINWIPVEVIAAELLLTIDYR